jgi:hypothetical protein
MRSLLLPLILMGCRGPEGVPTPTDVWHGDDTAVPDTADTATPARGWVISTSEQCVLPAWCDGERCQELPSVTGTPTFVHPDGALRLDRPEGALAWDGTWSTDPLLPAGFAFGFSEDDGTVWGTADSEVVRSQAGAPYTPVPGAPPGSFLAGTGVDALWVASSTFGLGSFALWHHWDGAAWVDAGQTFDVATTAVHGDPGELWVSDGSHLHTWTGTEFAEIELGGGGLRLLQAPDGGRWLLSSVGLYAEQGGQWVLDSPEPRSPGVFTGDGVLWATDTDNVLQRWVDGAWDPLLNSVEGASIELVARGDEVWGSVEGVPWRADAQGVCGGPFGRADDLQPGAPVLATWSDDDLAHVGVRTATGWSVTTLDSGGHPAQLVPDASTPTAVVARYTTEGEVESAVLQQDGAAWTVRATLAGVYAQGAVARGDTVWLHGGGEHYEASFELFRLDPGAAPVIAHRFESWEGILAHRITAGGTHWVLRDDDFGTRLESSPDGETWTRHDALPGRATGLTHHGDTLWAWGEEVVRSGDGLTWTEVCPGGLSGVQHVLADAEGAWITTSDALLRYADGALTTVALPPSRVLARTDEALWLLDDAGVLSSAPLPATGAPACP